MYHRPILHMRPLVACKLGYTSKVEEIVKVIGFAVLYMITHMFKEGKVENNINLIDLQKAKPWELPIKSLHAF